MLWIDLPDNWFSLSAQEKFLWYASNRGLKQADSLVSTDTYFINCDKGRGASVPDIADCDFVYVSEIEEAAAALLEELFNDESGFIIRITAAEMLKKCPIKTYTQENAKMDVKSDAPAVAPKKQDTKPPDFYYPL